MHRLLLVITALVILAGLTVAAAPSTPKHPAAKPALANPIYQAWQKQKVGASVEWENVNTSDDKKENSTTQVKWTLKEVKPDHALVEMVITMNGKSTPFPLGVAAKIASLTDQLPLGYTGDGKVTRKEAVEVLGKSYQCDVFEWTGTNAKGSKAWGTIWMNAQIPGALAKSELHDEKGNKSVVMHVTAINPGN